MTSLTGSIWRCVDVVEQLGAGVTLERVRRLVVLQVGGELRLGVRARAAGDGEVDEGVVRVLLP